MNPPTFNSDRLHRALDEIEAGGLTVQQYVARHPEAAELAPLLSAAERARRAGQDPYSLSPTRIAAGQARLLEHFRTRTRPDAGAVLGRRWAAAVAIVLIVIAASVGTVAASGEALPGEPLYPVKRLVESAELALTPRADQPELRVKLAAERLDEFMTLAARGDIREASLVEVDQAIEAALDDLSSAAVDRRRVLAGDLVDIAAREHSTLVGLLAGAPPSQQPELQTALEDSQRTYSRALELSQGSSPDNLSAATNTSTVLPSHSPTDTEAPASQTRMPPGLTQAPPGQTQLPPGQTKIPPGQTQVPPGQTRIPPGQVHTPPGHAQTPPGLEKTPPGQTQDDGNGNGNGNGGGNGNGNGGGYGNGSGGGNGNGNGGGNGEAAETARATPTSRRLNSS